MSPRTDASSTPAMALTARTARDAREACAVPQETDDAHLEWNSGGLGHVADVLLRGDRVVGDVDAAHDHAPGCGSQITGHHAHRRGLAGTVGTEKAQHFT